MPDSTNNHSINDSVADYIETMSYNQEQTLKSIDLTLKAIARRDGLIISQSSLQDLVKAERQSALKQNINQQTIDQRRRSNSRTQRNSPYRRSGDDSIDWNKREGSKRAGKMFDNLTDDFEDAFSEALFGSSKPFQNALRNSMISFADSLGVDVKDLGKEVGKRLGERAKSTLIGGRLARENQWMRNQINDLANRGLGSLSKWLGGTGNVNGNATPFDLFESDDSNEAPKVKDVDTIVNSSAETIKNTIYDASGNEMQMQMEGFRQVTEAILNSGQANINGLRNVDQNLSNVVDIRPEDANVVDENGQITSTIGDVVNGGRQLGNAMKALKGSTTSTSTELTTIAENAGATGGQLATLGETAGGAGAGAAEAAAAFPYLTLAMLAASVAIELLSEAMGPAIEGIKQFSKTASDTAMYSLTKSRTYINLRNERIKKDATAITEAAFNIMSESAKRIESVWDSVEATVAATQATTKAGVQELWGEYAERLRNEGLASSVSSADIMEKLQSVLNQGLTGKAAQEFAYQATVLNKAIPTQDFFQYASTYASIVANSIKSGKSQEEALSVANDELQSFANNLIYASNIVGKGLTTSLTQSASLFENAAKIAVASRTGDVSDIGAMLTSVSALVGSIAPDLADSIVTAVVSAATGGNSSELTALRSLAGTGASNTAFLQALAKDPEGVFATLFENLAGLQNMSSANYMEVAESLASTFGLSIDALARVDFQYLADALKNLNKSSYMLETRLNLLANGETTSTDEQLRIQKINEYMIDEGLAYVLDNEVARSIQEHMWEEQLNQQLMENTYAVNLVGSSAELLRGIKDTLAIIGLITDPKSWIKVASDFALQAEEALELDDRVENLIEAVKVGNGNESAKFDLINAGIDLELANRNTYLKDLGAKIQESSSITSSFLNGMNSFFGKSEYEKNTEVIKKSDVYKEGDFATIVDIQKSKDSLQRQLNNKQVSKSQAQQMVSGGITGAVNAALSATIPGYGAAQGLISLANAATDAGTILKNSKLNSKTYSGLFDTSGESVRVATQEDADTLTKAILSSISAYTEASDKSSKALINSAKRINEEQYGDRLTEDTKKEIQEGFIAHRDYYTQSELVAAVMNSNKEATKETTNTFAGWVQQFNKENNVDLEKELTLYDQSLQAVEALYEQESALRSSAETKARELHEVQFWEDMQHFATIDFPWFTREWERYYIQHEAYNSATMHEVEIDGEKQVQSAYMDAVRLQAEEKGEMGDSVLALAKALTDNSIWQEELGNKLADPQIQANTILAKILLTVEAIMQQNNETSIVSVPTALSSLGLGTTNY